MQDKLPRRIREYKVLSRLGHGSSAEVVLAQNFRGEKVAIKLLHEFITDEQIKQAFYKEAELIKQLRHPGIVSLLEADFDGPRPYLVMEYAPNGNLREWHKKSEGQVLSSNTIISYVHQIANALQYAHSQKIVHRDVKPENILLSKDYGLLLGDFGVALIIQTTYTQSHRTYGPAGTPTYMAPELFRGKPRQASDQYALGIMVYEWLYGHPPFKATTFGQLMNDHLHHCPPLLHGRNSKVSSAVADVLSRALEKKPNKRFPDVVTFALELEKAFRYSVDPTRNIGMLTNADCLTPAQVISSDGDKEAIGNYANSLPSNDATKNVPRHNTIDILNHQDKTIAHKENTPAKTALEATDADKTPIPINQSFKPQAIPIKSQDEATLQQKSVANMQTLLQVRKPIVPRPMPLRKAIDSPLTPLAEPIVPQFTPLAESIIPQFTPAQPLIALQPTSAQKPIMEHSPVILSPLLPPTRYDIGYAVITIALTLFLTFIYWLLYQTPTYLVLGIIFTFTVGFTSMIAMRMLNSISNILTKWLKLRYVSGSFVLVIICTLVWILSVILMPLIFKP